MKRQLMSGFVGLLLLTGCNEGTATYEKAISDFVQTDKKGTWTDLKFKVIEMGVPINITVADSVKILTEKFEAQKNNRLATLNESIERHTVSRDKERYNSMKQFYQSYGGINVADLC